MIRLLSLLLLIPALAAAQTAADISLGAATLEQRIGAQLPLTLRFNDESGRPVRLGEYFHGRPVILVPAWYSCPNLCGLTLRGLVAGLKEVEFQAGRDFQVVAVSIDPRDDAYKAQALKDQLVRDYGRPATADGWHLLTGAEPQIRQLAQSVGFGYRYDEAQQQYAHPATLVLAGGGGRVSRYLPGVVFPGRDLRLGLVETAQGRLGSVMDKVLLRCFSYDPVTGRYSLTIIRALQIAGGLLVVVMAGGIGIALWRERRRREAA